MTQDKHDFHAQRLASAYGQADSHYREAQATGDTEQMQLASAVGALIDAALALLDEVKITG